MYKRHAPARETARRTAPTRSACARRAARAAWAAADRSAFSRPRCNLSAREEMGLYVCVCVCVCVCVIGRERATSVLVTAPVSNR